MDNSVIRGAEVIARLAQRFPQLYVRPAEGADQAHRLASGRGIAPADASLAHFVTSADDELRLVATPAGEVEVVFLKERADFETFLQIVGHKSQPVPIARTVGAITYRGLADWGAVARAHQAYLDAGGDDWPHEFARLASQAGAFRCELVVISEGPYSNVSAAQAGFDPDEWIGISREIRLHHECAHVVCRRTMPDDVLAVWDEVTADVCGLICATGRYDAALAAKFLGVAAHGFVGGRLTEYLTDEQKADVERIAVEVCGSLGTIQQRFEAQHPAAFDFLLELKRAPLVAY